MKTLEDSAALVDTVCFRICPDWFTDLLRKLWLEQEYSKAFNILDAAFPEMEIQDKFYLVSGRKKLVYANQADAERTSTFNLVGDDWKPSGAFAGMKVATFTDVLEQCDLFSNNREAFGLLKEIAVMAHSANGIKSKKGCMTFKAKGSPVGWVSSLNVVELICRLFPEPTSEQWFAFWDKYGEEVRDIKDAGGDNFDVFNVNAGFEKLEKMVSKQVDDQSALAAKWGPQTATNIDVFLAHDRELDKRPTPIPDYSLEARDGWVLPDGKFYPCGYMEHIWLSGRLGKEEREAEAAGWIKISHGISGETYIHKGDRQPTQKQINTVFDWCEKHKFPLPDWAGGKDE